MANLTVNYGWTKPVVGGDTDAWGGELNSDLDGIDSTVFAVSGVANAALPLAGGILTGALTPAQVAGIVGTTTSNNAAAGAVGEYLSAQNTAGAAMTTNANVNITSLSLSAGDWDVQGNAYLLFSANGTIAGAWIATSSAGNPPANFSGAAQIAFSTSTLTQPILSTGMLRVSIATTTTVYLVGSGTFTSGTLTGSGVIMARRRR